MITLGFRELIINQDSRISGVGGPGAAVTIESLGTFYPVNLVLAAGNVIPAEAAALGQYTGAVPAITAVNAIVKFYFGLPGRPVGELFPEHESSVSFYITAATGAKLVDGIIPGFNDKVLTIADNGGAAFTIDFVSGYEGMSITRATIEEINANGSTAVGETSFALTEVVVPNPGLNTGKMLEQSVVLSTPENNPYGMNEYGHDQIDLRGTYTAYIIEETLPADGWRAHEAMGNQDVNQQLSYKNMKYMVYVNNATAAAGNVLLAELVTP